MLRVSPSGLKQNPGSSMVSASASKAAISTDVEEAVERFISLCRERGLSVTPQRLALYRALVSTSSHPTPERLFEDVRSQMPTLSLATVYKAIETFKEMGVIREIRVPDDHRMRLDGDVSEHHHLICVRCHQVVDLREGLADEPLLPEQAMQGFRILGYSLQFNGVCPGCDATG